jgi:hypothetical protein
MGSFKFRLGRHKEVTLLANRLHPSKTDICHGDPQANPATKGLRWRSRILGDFVPVQRIKFKLGAVRGSRLDLAGRSKALERVRWRRKNGIPAAW